MVDGSESAEEKGEGLSIPDKTAEKRNRQAEMVQRKKYEETGPTPPEK